MYARAILTPAEDYFIIFIKICKNINYNIDIIFSGKKYHFHSVHNILLNMRGIIYILENFYILNIKKMVTQNIFIFGIIIIIIMLLYCFYLRFPLRNVAK